MSMEDIISAAREEDWNFVDKKIPEVCNSHQNQEWAHQLLKDSDGHVVDLGASILEKANNIDPKRFSRMRARLKNVMVNNSDIYARYRSAFALAAHDPGRYKEEVIKVLKEATKDKDVSEIAKEYLGRLK
jgi:hypothetical protein